MISEVQLFLKSLTPPLKRQVVALRRVVRQVVPHARESVVWGNLSYHRPNVGGRVKGAICQIVIKNNQIRLDFIHGIHLADPKGLLQGDRISKRFVPIQSVSDTQQPEIADLIREASQFDPRL